MSSDCQHILFKTQEQCSSKHAVTISHSLKVTSDLSWSLTVHGQIVECPALVGDPERLTITSLLRLLHKIDSFKVCPGHPDKQFVQMAKAKGGIFMSQTPQSASAVLDTNGLHCLNGHVYDETIRSTKCHILVQGAKCPECVGYRTTLRVLYHKWLKQQDHPVHEKTNDRWLNPPQLRDRLQLTRSKYQVERKKVDYLKQKIKECNDSSAIQVDEELHEGLSHILRDYAPKIKQQYEPNSFHHLFWQQQVENMQKVPTQR